MMIFVENDEDVDAVIRIGTDHLSDDTSVYIEEYNQRVKCIIDLSAPDAFDKDGHYNFASRALLSAKLDLYSKPDHEDRLAFIVNANDQRLDFKSGRYIFINPDHLH